MPTGSGRGWVGVVVGGDSVRASSRVRGGSGGRSRGRIGGGGRSRGRIGKVVGEGDVAGDGGVRQGCEGDGWDGSW